MADDREQTLPPLARSSDERNAAPRTGATQHRVQDFELLRRIGSGASGVVYEAIDALGTRVALKVMTHPATGIALQRFVREAQVLMSISHPNLVKALNTGTTLLEEPYIVFELLEGETLRQRLDRGPLSAAQAIDLGVDICSGLSALHEKGFVHRDVSPKNIICCTDGTIKILDFGSAHSEHAEDLTIPGEVIGTPAYFSPEQASGSAVVDARTDIWAIGAVLYESVTGHGPFPRKGQSLAARLLSVVSEPLRPLAEMAPIVPAALSSIIERALRRDMHERWRSASEMEAALTAARTGSDPRADASEHRFVVLLEARGVSNYPLLRRAVDDGGGSALDVGDQTFVASFGSAAWKGDELRRARAAAHAARLGAETISVRTVKAWVRGGILEQAFPLSLEKPPSPTPATRVDPAPKELFVQHDAPLIGRDAEVAQLRHVTRALVSSATSQCIVLSGLAGMGKTRLCDALAGMLRDTPAPTTRPYVVLRGRNESNREGHAYSLVSSALRARCTEKARLAGWPGLDASTPLAERRRAIELLAAEAVSSQYEREETALVLADVLGVPLTAQRPSSMPPAERIHPQWPHSRSPSAQAANRAMQGLMSYFLGLGRTNTLALIVDDAQWADPESLALFEELAVRLAKKPFLLFLATRSEDLGGGLSLVPSLVRKTITLNELLPEESCELASWLMRRPLNDFETRRLCEYSGGNPMFVEQLARAILDEPVRGTARATPFDVQAAVQSRLEHLSEEERRVCRAAAVFDRTFVEDEVGALVERPVRNHLQSLVQRSILRVVADDEGLRRYTVNGRLVSDVAYAMIPAAERIRLHARAASHLADQGAPPDELARHFESADDLDRAAEQLVAAGLGAARIGDSRTLLAMSDRALMLAPRLDGIDSVTLRIIRVDALQFLGHRGAVERELERALDVAATSAERARLLAEKAWYLFGGGLIDPAVKEADAAVAEARRSQQEGALIWALGRSIVILSRHGDLERARRYLHEVGALVGHYEHAEVQGAAASWRGQLAAELGDVAEMAEAFAIAASHYVTAGDVRRAAAARANLAALQVQLGAFLDAEDSLRIAVDECRRVEHRRMEGYARANLGHVLEHLGRHSEARSEIQIARAIATETNEKRLELYARLYELRLDTANVAPHIVERARAIASEAQATSNSAIVSLALMIAASAELTAGRLDSAEALSRESFIVLERNGALSEGEGEVFVTRARCLAACGEDAEALLIWNRGRAAVIAKAERIRDPEMSRRFLTDVPAHRLLMTMLPNGERAPLDPAQA